MSHRFGNNRLDNFKKYNMIILYNGFKIINKKLPYNLLMMIQYNYKKINKMKYPNQIY